MLRAGTDTPCPPSPGAFNPSSPLGGEKNPPLPFLGLRRAPASRTHFVGRCSGEALPGEGVGCGAGAHARVLQGLELRVGGQGRRRATHPSPCSSSQPVRDVPLGRGSACAERNENHKDFKDKVIHY